MTTWFVSHHPGALDWMQRYGVMFDCHIAHLDIEFVITGDTVIGSLPVNLAAEICARGAEYWHLSLCLAAQGRGRELSAEEMQIYDANLECYDLRKSP